MTESAIAPLLWGNRFARTWGYVLGPVSVELFTGIGGLALGLSRAGIRHALLVERDRNALATLRHNMDRGVAHIAGWPVAAADIRDVDWASYRGKIDVIAGGPPCQPFGIGGKKRGHTDDRDMWPEAMRAVRIIRPAAFVFENVRNLAGPRFGDYLAWIKEGLRRPDHPRRNGQGHELRHARLGAAALYTVDHVVVNAADFGAPQIRWRVLVRGQLGHTALTSLRPDHSLDRLLWDQWVSGDYWLRHGVARPGEPGIPMRCRSRVARLRALGVVPEGKPWRTVRDAIADLGEPNGVNGHVMQPGARVYKGHTGSPLDMPAKALKAGDHGVPGGENMLAFAGGSVRYLTVREAARLMNLPDDVAFPASWSETMRGIGNAVPVALGEAIGRWLLASVGLRARGSVKAAE